MSNPTGPNAEAGRRDEQQEEPIVVRDRRRIDPLTGEVRPPASDAADAQAAPAGGSPTAGTDATGTADDARVAELEKQLEERTADLQRITAEYANYRRRVDRDRESVLVGAKVSFVSDLLTVLDDIERAEQHGDLNGPFKAVADKVVGVATNLGLEAFGVVDELFDPTAHEAVQHEPASEPGPTVTVLSSVLRRGYRIGDRVLRPAMVTVVDRPEPQLESAQPDPAQDPVPAQDTE